MKSSDLPVEQRLALSQLPQQAVRAIRGMKRAIRENNRTFSKNEWQWVARQFVGRCYVSIPHDARLETQIRWPPFQSVTAYNA
jgi:hypothetical protein